VSGFGGRAVSVSGFVNIFQAAKTLPHCGTLRYRRPGQVGPSSILPERAVFRPGGPSCARRPDLISGLDVHAAKVVPAVVDSGSGELRGRRLRGRSSNVAEFCAGLPFPGPGDLGRL
jgi:hypothetical protein